MVEELEGNFKISCRYLENLTTLPTRVEGVDPKRPNIVQMTTHRGVGSRQLYDEIIENIVQLCTLV